MVLDAANKDASPQKHAARRWVFAPYGVPRNSCRDLKSGLSSTTMDCRERQSGRLSVGWLQDICSSELSTYCWSGGWGAGRLADRRAVGCYCDLWARVTPTRFQYSLAPAWGVAGDTTRVGQKNWRGRKKKGSLGVRTALSKSSGLFFPFATKKRCPGPALPKSQTVISLRGHDRPT